MTRGDVVISARKPGLRFSDKVAVVTGGSSGIGKAVAQKFAHEGAAVAVIASSDIAKASSVAVEIGEAGGTAAAFVADVRNVASIDEMIHDVVKTFGHIDILVNSAGVYYSTPLGKTSESSYNRMVDINLKGTFFSTNAVASLFKSQGSGKIVNIASASAYTATREFSLYCAVKAGIIMLTRALALELAPHGINVNAIAPGNTATPMNEEIRTKPEFKDLLATMSRATPSKRTYSEPEEMAAIIAFLASEETQAMNGATVLVDQGRTAGLIY
jgi:NAD(P)-dependent dehydrogenase (short-subunit alcohol dehydrogenase family)